jgi:hypothetical protein
LGYKIRDDVIGMACGKYTEDKIIPCLISGFRREVDEICVFLNAVLKFIRFGGKM